MKTAGAWFVTLMFIKKHALKNMVQEPGHDKFLMQKCNIQMQFQKAAVQGNTILLTGLT